MMIRTCALIAVLIAGALFDFARGGDLVECEPQWVAGDGRHWAYRIVDGRETTRLDQSVASLFVLPANEHQHVALVSLVDALDPTPRPAVRSRLVTG
jgi:hypothetical protein